MNDITSDLEAPALVVDAFDGRIDIVGDVHGELGALEDLLRVLGYHGRGEHAGGRRLVFIGDLCDRGPDSPGVIQRVEELVREGTAQCLLGNHEMNALRGSRKEANGWFFEHDHDRAHGNFTSSRPAEGDEGRRAIQRFFSSLPLALERPDLRLVHACWDDVQLEQLRADSGRASAVELYRVYAQRADERARAEGWLEEAEDLERQYKARLRNRDVPVPMLEALARRDVDYQMSNPLRVLTSGPERRADAPFYMSGKWRMVERVDWWDDYRDPVPVVFGHYWRWPTPAVRERFGSHAQNLFPGRAADEWIGPAENTFCVDFCAGARFHERAGWPGQPFRSRLAAVRWPEREVIFDDGSGATIVSPRRP